MTDTARLRELSKMVAMERRDDSVEEREFEHLVNAALDAEIRKALPDLLTAAEERDALKAENERMRAVVEAARAWGKTGLSNDQLQKVEDNLRQALAALDTGETERVSAEVITSDHQR